MENKVVITWKDEPVGLLVVEPRHLETFKLFRWHAKAPFMDCPKAYLLFSPEEREKNIRDGGTGANAYHISASRLAWMLEAEPERMWAQLSHWKHTGNAILLSQELKRPFRMLFRTANKLNVEMMNIKCPALAEARDLPNAN